jgi:hypothetical protein
VENRSIGATEFEKELRDQPAVFFEHLKILLGAARERVWVIIQNKYFTSFTDAQALVKVYDHLNKILSIFEAYQLPLPEKKDEPAPAKSKRRLALIEK